jgi:hypothetical protein
MAFFLGQIRNHGHPHQLNIDLLVVDTHAISSVRFRWSRTEAAEVVPELAVASPRIH